MPLIRHLLLLIVALSPLLAISAVSPDQAWFDGEIRRIVADKGVPGAAYAIVADGKIAVAEGIGVRDITQNQPVSADTVFRIASVSKTFAAQLAAMLVEEGRLDWNAPLPTFAPDFRLKNGAQQGIQLRHVMGQSSGLTPNAYDNLVDAGQSLAQILPQFRSLQPACAPGQCYGYQNILFAQSARAIESASGRDFSELVTKRLFVPLGLRNTSIGMDAFLASADSAMPHIKRDGHWQRTAIEANYYQLPAAAGVNASVNDLARWLIAQMGGYPDIVRASQIEQLTTPRVKTPKDLRRGHWKDLLTSAHYGLGWRIYRIGDEPIILHAGWVKGYVAEVSYSPRLRSGLVVLMNGESGSALTEAGTIFWRHQLGLPALAPAVLPASTASVTR